jgi:hypothetical protein
MSNFETTKAVNAEIDGTLALLDTEFNLDETMPKNVLFVGLTGTGKSTLCQFLAGNQNLSAVKKGGSYLISDGDVKVSESTTISKTLIPELVPLPNTQTVLADCPGFSDTRSARYDIAAAVFTKKLLDNSEKVKIMVTAAHHSVQRGIDRSSFTNLLSHLVHFIKNIEKYKDSIGFLVTKVENQFTLDDDGNFKLTPDIDIIDDISSFINDVKTELMEKYESSNNSDNVAKQIQLIDLFLTKNDKNEYSRIGIFRRPIKIGNLYSDPYLSKNKNDMEKIMNYGIRSSQVEPNDFGLSLSKDSKFIINEMREILNIKQSSTLDEYIRVYSKQEIDGAADNIESIKNATTRLISIVDVLESEIGPGLVVTNLLDRVQKLDPEHPSKQNYVDWKNQQKYFQFLESVFPTTEGTNDYNKYSERLIDFKQRISEKVQLMGHNAENSIDKAISEVITQMMMTFKKQIVNSLILSTQLLNTTFPEQNEDSYKRSDLLRADINNGTDISFQEFLNRFRVSFKFSEHQEDKLRSLQTDIDFFKKKINPTFTDGHQEKWLQGFTAPMNDVKREVNNKLSETLDEYIGVISQQSSDYADGNIENMKNDTIFIVGVVDLLKSEIVPNLVITKLMVQIKELDPQHPSQKSYVDWRNLQKLMLFLESVLPTTEAMNDFSKYHKRLEDFKKRISKMVNVVGNSAEKTIDQAISGVIAEVMIAFKNKSVSLILASQQLNTMFPKQNEDNYMMSDLSSAYGENGAKISFNEFMKKFRVSFIVARNQAYKLESIQSNIDLFKQKIDPTFTDGHQEIWLQGFAAPMNDVKEVANNKLSEILDEYISVFSQQPTDCTDGNFEKFKKPTIFMVNVVGLLKSEIAPNLSITKLLDQIKELDPQHPSQKSNADWRNLQKFMGFLKSVHPTTEFTNEYGKYYKRLEDFKNRTSEKVKVMGRNAEEVIDQKISEVISHVMTDFKNETISQILTFQQSKTLFPELNEKSYKMSDLSRAYSENGTKISFNEFFKKFRVSFKVAEHQKPKFDMIQSDISYFKSKVTATFVDGHQEKWLQGFLAPIDDIKKVANKKLSNILDDYIRIYSQPPIGTVADNIESIKNVTSRLVSIVDALKTEIRPNLMVTSLMDRIQELDSGHPAQQYHTDWKNLQKYTQFLESAFPAKDYTNDFNKYHVQLNHFKHGMTQIINQMGLNAAYTINQSISNVITEIMMAFKNETFSQRSTQQSYKKSANLFSHAFKKLEQFVTNNGKKMYLTFSRIHQNIEENFKISANQNIKLETNQDNIEFFKKLVSHTFFDGHQEVWLKGFAEPFNEIRHLAEWYSFIADSYESLIKYEHQNVIKNSKSDLKNWENFKKLGKELSGNRNLDEMFESRSTLSAKEQDDLNNLIDAIQPSLDHTCNSGTLVVKGKLVKLSKVVDDLIPKCSSFVELYIFGTQTVFIDVSLQASGKNVYIIAPTWHIMNPQTINLRGIDANLVGRTEAGDPGQPGGNFIGIGDQFINENDLSINVSGGNGGNGKSGKDGVDGKDGITPPVPSDTIWHNNGSWDYCDTVIERNDIAGWRRFSKHSDIYQMFGTHNATSGTHAENGGKYGFGAKPGKIFMDSPKVNRIESMGENGEDGKGGKGGKAGKHGGTVSFTCIEKTRPGMFKFAYPTHIIS